MVATFQPREQPTESTVCPECQGPAEVQEFWSISPKNPEFRILKRQVLCGRRPKQSGRFGKTLSSKFCKTVTVDVRLEAPDDDAPVPAAVPVPPEPVTPKPLAQPEKLPDQVVEFLAELDDDQLKDLRELAKLTPRQNQLRHQLDLRLGA